MSVQYELDEQPNPTPSMMDMVTEAVLEMNDRKGASMQAIKRYCQDKYGLDYENGNDKVELTKALRTGVTRGVFIQDKGSYRIGSSAGMTQVQAEGGPKRKKKKEGTGKRRGPGGLTKPMILSPELAAVCGGNRMGRTDVMKNLWVYIKANNLQDPANKRNIICDEKLQRVFNETSVNMFTMAKYISAHLSKPDDSEEVQASEHADAQLQDEAGGEYQQEDYE